MADIHPSRKRKLGDGSGGAPPHAKKFKKQGRREKPGNNKPGNNRSNAPQSDGITESTNVLKRRIRDLKRILRHVDSDPTKKIPQTVRNEQERELEACEHELAEKQAHKLENDFKNKIIGKYHHIRFFERQKATRTVKRLKKQLAELEDESEKAALLQSIHNAEVDVNYTTYYPLLRPYLSLFPRAQKGESASAEDKRPAAKLATEFEDGPKGNVEIWKAVEKAMEEGTLDALRNSREGVTMPGPKDPMIEGRKTKQDYNKEKKQKQEKTAAPMNEDDDSDGGFFE